MAESAPKKQHTVEYIAIAALVLIAVIMGIARFKKGDTDDEVFSRKEFNKQWAEVEILEAGVPKKETEVAYAGNPDKIPFKSPFDEAEQEVVPEEQVTLPTTLTFQGMIWKSSRPQAIINNKVYDVNDIVNLDTGGAIGDEIKVKDVTNDGIHLIYKKKEFIVRPKAEVTVTDKHSQKQ